MSSESYRDISLFVLYISICFMHILSLYQLLIRTSGNIFNSPFRDIVASIYLNAIIRAIPR